MAYYNENEFEERFVPEGGIAEEATTIWDRVLLHTDNVKMPGTLNNALASLSPPLQPLNSEFLPENEALYSFPMQQSVPPQPLTVQSNLENGALARFSSPIPQSSFSQPPKEDGYYPDLIALDDSDYPEEGALTPIEPPWLSTGEAETNPLDEIRELEARLRGLKKTVNRDKCHPKGPFQKLHQEKDGDDELDVVSKEPGTKKVNIEQSKNGRGKNRMKFKPQNHYILPPARFPQRRWVSQADNAFQYFYTPQGELEPQTRYSVEELQHFMWDHPLNYINSQASELVLWIQHAPSDVAHRYPTKDSSICRFADCIDPKGMIRNGQLRICFDENNYDPESAKYDPYHNAGYVHLYCLEYFCNFPQICQGLNVQGDNRVSNKKREGVERFSIIRDRPELLKVCNEFIQNASNPYIEPAQSVNCLKDGDYNDAWYKTTLCYALTTKHLQLQTDSKRRMREKRGGNSIDQHLNNLHVRLQGENKKRAEAKEARRANEGQLPPKSRKRKAAEVEEGDEDVLDDGILDSPRKQNRATKKARR